MPTTLCPPLAPCASCGRSAGKKGGNAAYRRRGLCRECYRKPTVREKYPYTGTLSGLNGRLLVSRPGGAAATPPSLGQPPPAPVHHEPGSAEKLRAMRERVALGLSPLHPAGPHWPLRERAFAAAHAWLWRLLAQIDPSILTDLQTLARVQP